MHAFGIAIAIDTREPGRFGLRKPGKCGGNAGLVSRIASTDPVRAIGIAQSQPGRDYFG
jgi:hypothetical protein